MTRRIVSFRVGVAALMLAVSALTVGKVMAETEVIEEPPFDVVDTVGSIEIRRYGPRLAAEANMGPGEGVEDGQYSAFMALADFIFAKNRQGPTLAMTAPVAMERTVEPIAMTAPVAMEPGEEGRVMRFFMPAEYTLETLPRPGDDRVQIVTVPPRHWRCCASPASRPTTRLPHARRNCSRGWQGATGSRSENRGSSAMTLRRHHSSRGEMRSLSR